MGSSSTSEHTCCSFHTSHLEVENQYFGHDRKREQGIQGQLLVKMCCLLLNNETTLCGLIIVLAIE